MDTKEPQSSEEADMKNEPRVRRASCGRRRSIILQKMHEVTEVTLQNGTKLDCNALQTQNQEMSLYGARIQQELDQWATLEINARQNHEQFKSFISNTKLLVEKKDDSALLKFIEQKKAKDPVPTVQLLCSEVKKSHSKESIGSMRQKVQEAIQERSKLETVADKLEQLLKEKTATAEQEEIKKAKWQEIRSLTAKLDVALNKLRTPRECLTVTIKDLKN